MQTRTRRRHDDNATRVHDDNATRVRIVEIITSLAVMTIFAFFFAWVLINWLSGCGETFVTYTGAVIEGECVLMPWRD